MVDRFYKNSLPAATSVAVDSLMSVYHIGDLSDGLVEQVLGLIQSLIMLTYKGVVCLTPTNQV